MRAFLEFMIRQREKRRKGSIENNNDFLFTVPSVQITNNNYDDNNMNQIATSHGEETESINNADDNTNNQQNDGSNINNDDNVITPFLYSLAKRWAWNAVSFRCASHPQEADFIDYKHGGDTALHWTCFGSPPFETVQALLQACPKMARVANTKQGDLPLHVACSYRASEQVIIALVQAYPEACAIRNYNGSYPLHLLCDYGCSIQSIQAVLQTSAGVASVPFRDGIYQRTPLALLNERKNMAMFHRYLQELRRQVKQNNNENSTTTTTRKQRDDMDRFQNLDIWKKASLLLRAQYLQRPLTQDDIHYRGIILQACLKYPCPPALREYALLAHADELLDFNEHGQLPIHTATTAISTTQIMRTDQYHYMNSSLILEVLRPCPQAARITCRRTGLLPLQLYLQEKQLQLQPVVGSKKHVIEQLLLANSLALETLDLDLRLYPFIWYNYLLKNLSSQEQPETIWSAIYESIRANPIIFSSQQGNV